MNEPKRWLDEGAPQVIGHMLRAAGDEQPSATALERAVTGLAISAGITSSTIGAAGAPLASGVFLKWTLLGTLATLTAAGLAVGVSKLRNEPIAAPASSNAAALRAPPAPAQQRVEPIRSDQTVAIPSANAAPTKAGSEPRREPDALKSRPESPATEVTEDAESLARETKLVDRARAELAAGRAAAALVSLDEYQTQFPVPRYAPEALYLRMDALLALGSTQAAQQVARRLASSYPRSPHAARAEAVLSGTIP